MDTRPLTETHNFAPRISSEAKDNVPFGVTYEKIGTIQRRLAWPLHKDDTLFRVECTSVHNIYFALLLKFSNYTKFQYALSSAAKTFLHGIVLLPFGLSISHLKFSSGFACMNPSMYYILPLLSQHNM